MHLFLEQLQKPNSYCDSNLLSLSWMGRVPDHLLQQNWDHNESNDLLDEDIWRLNRINYYEQGWLATGNQRGMVGVTYSSCKPPPSHQPIDSDSNASMPGCSVPLGDWQYDKSLPSRCNYNLRGHRNEVVLVRWNEPYQKLATVDSSGVIFVWTKYEGRWSIELINDRAIQVMDFAWSHDGRLALICYVDGFLLIGSVAGQRYWSSALSLDGAQLTCGVWTPDDRLVLVGLSNGCLLVITLAGTLLGQYQLRENNGIQRLCWSCAKFRLEEDTNERNMPYSNVNQASQDLNGEEINAHFQPLINEEIITNRKASIQSNTSTNSNETTYSQTTITPETSHVLCVCFDDGELLLLKDYDDPQPKRIKTNLLSPKLDWSEHGQILAVAGHRLLLSNSTKNSDTINQENLSQFNQPYYENMLHFYCGQTAYLKYRIRLPYHQAPVTALTWGHNDKRLFVATGNVLHVAWITKRVPSLQLLSRLAVHKNVRDQNHLNDIGLPEPLRLIIQSLFARTLRCPLPSIKSLRRFVFLPPPGQRRYYCTLIRHADPTNNNGSNAGHVFILYLEYLGGLVPLLKGKRVSQLKPEFVIYDPIAEEFNTSTKYDSELACKTFGSMIIKEMRQSRLLGKKSFNQQISQRETLLEQIRKITRVNSLKSNLNQLYWINDFWNGYNYSANRGHTPLLDHHSMYRGINTWLINQLRSAATSFPYLSTNNNLAPNSATVSSTNGSFDYIDEMPETCRLILITANLWGTRFKVVSLVPWFPQELCSISYRTSLLHLQPRQMCIRIKELSPATNLNEDTNTHSPTEDFDPKSLYHERTTSLGLSGINSGRFYDPIYDINILNNSNSSRILDTPTPPPPPPPVSPPNMSLSSNNDNVWGYSVLDDYRAATVAPTTPRFVRRQISETILSPNQSPPNQSNNQSVDCSSIHNVDYNEFLTKSNINNLDREELLTLQIMQDLNGFNYNLHLQPEEQVLQSTVSTQTSFPSFSEISERQSILSKSMIQPNVSQVTLSSIYDGPVFLRALPIRSKQNCSMPPQRHSMDFSLCRRLTLKKEDRPIKTENNKDNAKNQIQRLLRNRMYLDEEYEDAGHDEIDAALAPINLSQTLDSAKFSRRSNTFCGSMQHHSASFDNKMLQNIFKCASEQSETLEYAETNVTSMNTSNHSLAKITELWNKTSDENWQFPTTPVHQRRRPSVINAVNCTNDSLRVWSSSDSEEPIIERISYGHTQSQSLTNRPAIATAQSLPASPLLDQFRVDKRKKSLSKTIFYSPVLLRKAFKKRLHYLDCSSDDDKTSDEETDSVYFDRQHMKSKPKIKKSKNRSWRNFKRSSAGNRIRPDCQLLANDVDVNQEEEFPELQLRNKAPVWNELSQVYQLDFGGRVTQESAKNFQIEHQQRQVLQFGRIDTNTYTLDFQHPFSALQALSIALANVTQRLK